MTSDDSISDLLEKMEISNERLTKIETKIGVLERGRKRKKRNVDPNRPKKPLSAFMKWAHTTRKAFFAKKYPGKEIEYKEQLKILGAHWKKAKAMKTPPKFIANYEAIIAKEKEEYDKNMEEYIKNHPEATIVESKSPVRVSKKKVPEKKAPPPKKATTKRAPCKSNSKRSATPKRPKKVYVAPDDDENDDFEINDMGDFNDIDDILAQE